MKLIWLTSGSAAWTNDIGAVHLAKKRAGIANIPENMTHELSPGPFKLVDREVFFNTVGNKEFRCFGVVQCRFLHKEKCHLRFVTYNIPDFLFFSQHFADPSRVGFDTPYHLFFV